MLGANRQAETFQAWRDIGAALAIGKAHALKVTGANRAWGRNYSRALHAWMAEAGFGAMRPSDRSYAIELHENIAAITAWRDGLPERQRRRLVGAQANVKRWRSATAGLKEDRARDHLQRDAMLHWKRFRACLERMPPDQAAMMWSTVAAEVEERQTPNYSAIWQTT